MRKIHAMAALGKIPELNALLDSGVSVDDMDCNGNTPLYYAEYFQRHDVLSELEERGADVNSKDELGLTQKEKALKDSLDAISKGPYFVDGRIVEIDDVRGIIK